MADLDDFFAKKDRRRNKGAAKTDEGKRETKERPRPREGEEPRAGEEEEWKDYEETVKDYTGLKIQVLQGGGAGQGTESSTGAEESVGGQEAGKPAGPWKKPDLPDEPEPPKPAPPPPAKSGGAYRPPSARNVDAPIQNTVHTRHMNAPDIRNADFFPVLGTTGKPRGGGWSTATGAPAAPAAARRRPLALDNRFTSLQDDS